MSKEFLQEALKYAALGIPVFPCYPGRKKPSNENGFKGATTDPDKIRKWWSESPKAGIGVATGEPSGLVILDIDPEKNGQDSLDYYLAKHGPLPETVTSKTGGGGLHYLFQYPGFFVPSSQNKVAPGIDIRADRGYAVMPPSRHPGGGTYQWLHSLDDVALVDTPQWLLDRIREADDRQNANRSQIGNSDDESSAPNVNSLQMAHFDNTKPIPSDTVHQRAIAYIENSPGAISESDGHKTTFWLATALIHGFQLDPGVALQILTQYHNPRCKPPWSDKELQHKVQSSVECPPKKTPGWLLESGREQQYADVDISGIAASSPKVLPKSKSPMVRAKSPIIQTDSDWKPFPIDVFPDSICRFAQEGASAMIVDEVFFGLPILITASSAIGNLLRVQLKPRWEEPAIIWGAILGRSGTTKTPPLQAVVDPLQLLDNAELERYQAELVVIKEPLKPKDALRYVTNDVTIEGLVKQLGVSADGLLVFVDELAGWVKSFGQYKRVGSDMENWLSLYNGHPLKVDRKIGPPIYIPRASCSILGGIQPGAFRRSLREEHYDAGLVARILLSKPPEKQKIWTDEYLTDQSVEAWDRVVQRLLTLRVLTCKNNLQSPVVRLSTEALELYKAFFNRRGEEIMTVEHEALRAAYAKLEGGAARLALIVHCLRWGAGEFSDNAFFLMDEISMIAGIRLSDWFLEESRRIYSDFDGDAHMQLADWIEDHGGKTTASNLHKRRKSKYPSKQDAEKAIQLLVDECYGEWKEVQNKNGGPLKKEFHLTSE